MPKSLWYTNNEYFINWYAFENSNKKFVTIVLLISKLSSLILIRLTYFIYK